MGSDESSIPIGSTLFKAVSNAPLSGQITIAVHGKRRVGKTSLIQKMKNTNLDLQYEPTSTMQATEFFWSPLRHPDETIKITVWDVVDSAIPGKTSSPNVLLPDAQTVDTFSTTDGIIIMYDPDSDETVDYAVDMIKRAPPKLPILCMANFLDRRKMVKMVPEKLAMFSDRILHVQASIFSNRGLPIVAEWLDIPLLFNQQKRYLTLIGIAEKEIEEFDAVLNEKIDRASCELFQVGREDDNEDFDEKMMPEEISSDFVPKSSSYNAMMEMDRKANNIFSSSSGNIIKEFIAQENSVDDFQVKLNFDD